MAVPGAGELRFGPAAPKRRAVKWMRQASQNRRLHGQHASTVKAAGGLVDPASEFVRAVRRTPHPVLK